MSARIKINAIPPEDNPARSDYQWNFGVAFAETAHTIKGPRITVPSATKELRIG